MFLSSTFFAVYDYSSPYGESCYRLMARTGQFIYLRTRGYLDIDRDTNQVRSFVCHNTLVDEDEGKRLVNEMKKKFAIMIQETEFSTTDTEAAGVENPDQIVDAVLSLVTDLHGSDDARITMAEPSKHTDSNDLDRNVKSPPLNIIAPNASTIKSSITKSVTVIGSASKCMQYNTRRSDDSSSDIESDVESQKRWRPSVAQATSTNETLSPPNMRESTSSTTCPHIGEPSAVIPKPIVKKEVNDRVPPLPSSEGYFDDVLCRKSPHSSTSSSPPEFKPFTFSTHCEPSFPPPHMIDAQPYLTDNVVGVDSQLGRNYLKRPRFDDDYESDSKRRYRAAVLYDSSNTSIEQSIDDLMNPDLGMRANRRIKKSKIIGIILL